MSVIVLFCCLLKSYRFLQILQLEHYEVKKYFKYLISNYLYYNLVPLSCLVTYAYFDNDITKFISVIILFLFLFMATTVSIVRLKFTKKIIRIYIFLIPFLILNFFVNSIVYFLLFEIMLLLPYLLNKPIDKYINKKYLIQSSEKFNNFDNIKIGITGSYGKTSTKNIINDLLKNKLLGSCSYKSYNTLLGISKYINDIPLEAYDYVILEYGASRLGDIEELTNYFKPDIACVTEIGYMHLNTFKSIENILEEKMSIIKNCKVAILNYEQLLIREYKTDKQVISYGFNYGDFQAKNIEINHNYSNFDLYYKDEFIINVTTKLVGRHQILNLLCSICILFYLKIDIKEVLESINNISNTQSRLVLKKYQKYQILDDSYNANLVGSINALEILKSIDTKKVLITPGYVENNDVELHLYKEFSNKIIEVKPFVILVGHKQTKVLYDYLKGNVDLLVVDSFKQAMNYVNEFEDYCTILIENDLPDNYKRMI